MQMLIKDAARLQAENTLRTYWPSGRFPVDVAKIALSMGIRVHMADLPHNTSGMIIKHANDDATIYFDRHDSPQRQNFTCAHELGHFVERSTRSKPDEDFQFVDLRSKNRHDAHEFYANEFAANLLMPEAAVRQQHRVMRSTIELAEYFGVSLPAMKLRLSKLGLPAA
ncbi:ImmA/IrrE family metallo-endopeptidase [Sinomonas soli]